MYYKDTVNLPESIQQNLPEYAQEIYLDAFNKALKGYKDPYCMDKMDKRRRVAHRIAWNTVKSKFVKNM